jgi:hypothetical protein
VIARSDPRPVVTFRRHNTKLVTPRDFDLSPYFEVVKFNHLGDPRLNYREIVWDDSAAAPAQQPQSTVPAVPVAAAVEPAAAATARVRLSLRPVLTAAWAIVASSTRRFPI